MRKAAALMATAGLAAIVAGAPAQAARSSPAGGNAACDPPNLASALSLYTKGGKLQEVPDSRAVLVSDEGHFLMETYNLPIGQVKLFYDVSAEAPYTTASGASGDAHRFSENPMAVHYGGYVFTNDPSGGIDGDERPYTMDGEPCT